MNEMSTFFTDPAPSPTAEIIITAIPSDNEIQHLM